MNYGLQAGSAGRIPRCERRVGAGCDRVFITNLIRQEIDESRNRGV